MASESVFDPIAVSTGQTADNTERLALISPGAPLETSDYSPPFAPIETFGVDVAPGEEKQLLPAAPGRVEVIVVATGGAGGVAWLGLGQTAQAGVGVCLGPGGSLEKPLSCAIRALNAGTVTIHLSGQGFAA